MPDDAADFDRAPGSENAPVADIEATSGPPRWVKVFGIVAAALLALLVVALVVSGGDHGPGRHSGGDGAPPAAVTDGGHAPPAGVDHGGQP